MKFDVRAGSKRGRPALPAVNYNKRWHDAVWSTILATSRRSPFFGKSLELAGHVSSFGQWQRARGFQHARCHPNRQSLWATVLPRLASGPVTVLEFGVAQGATTREWLEAIDNPELRWHGFDVFTGLPQPWVRGGLEFAPKGAFDANGEPPSIDDSRVTWHAGLVEETLPRFELVDSGRLCVLFDLDLYEPKAFALDHLTPHLRPGAMLYFDEAYDPAHERRLIDEFIGRGHRLHAMGTTGIALLFEYQGGPDRASDVSDPGGNGLGLHT